MRLHPVWLFMCVFAVSLTALAADPVTSTNINNLGAELQNLSGNSIANKPMLVMLVLMSISLLPFVGMMVTSFVKIAVVLSITRQAIGTQQAPPTMVITGLAIILTVYVMHPVGMKVYDRAEKHLQKERTTFFSMDNADTMIKVVQSGLEPIKEFLRKKSDHKNIQLFYNLAHQMRQGEARDNLKHHDMIVLVPAFVISELTKAFEIGFIIFLPFLIIDMVVSNILMALGMQMLSPTTISLPFKILLFVMVDGWYLIAKGLVMGYQ